MLSALKNVICRQLLFVLRSRPRYELFLITIFICTLILFHIFVDIYSSKPDQSNTYDQKQNRRHDHNKLFITMTCGNRPEHLVCQCQQIKPGHCINRQSCIFLRMNTPKTTPLILPVPPTKDTPPITQAAIASHS